MSPGIGGHDMLGLYAEGISRMPENPGIPPLFRDIFKNAYLPYRDPETLKSFLKIIHEFRYDHSERLGDAFEYLLSVLGSQGDAGQFRTPRHIIDFIVSIVDPKKDETILDPACGTAGFLISAYKHILRANTDAKGKVTLTPDERGRLARHIKGYDISPDMVRLSLVNLYLHGFALPQIYEYDTLTSDDRWNETADIILANPPFMTPKGGITPHKRFSVQSKRSEVQFVDYFLEHLSPNGRAGIIVPEGIHFVAQSGYKQLRRNLIEDEFLLADITLPHGVFKPYASVKTHILILDRPSARRSKEVLFVEVDNDGYSQSDTREPISGSQLPDALSCVQSFAESIHKGRGWSSPNSPIRAYTVAKEAIFRTKDYHLLGRWYDLPNRTVHRRNITLKTIGDLCEIHDGLSSNMGSDPGPFPMVVPAAERKTADHYDFEGEGVCIPLVSSSGHGKADIKRLHYQEGQFALASTMCVLFPRDADVLNARFLYLYLTAACRDLLVPLMCGATNVTMSSDQLRDVLIPVPSVKVQREIVECDLIDTALGELRGAISRVQKSSDDLALALAKEIASKVTEYERKARERTSISAFLPSGSDEIEASI